VLAIGLATFLEPRWRSEVPVHRAEAEVR
jgi:hypothetical protein